MRFLTAVILAAAIGIPGIDLSDPFGLEGQMYRIYCQDDSFESLMREYYPGYEAYEGETAENEEGVISKSGRIGDTEVLWTIVPDDRELYESLLDTKLMGVEELDENERVDLFIFDEDSASKYCSEEADVAMKLSELGIADKTDNQYEFTKIPVTDPEGEQRASAYELTAGAFVYRRSIAEKVLGSADIETVSEYVSDWDRIEETAALMKENGYRMFASSDETFAPFFYSMGGWVDEAGTIIVSPEVHRWAEMAQTFSEDRYSRDGRRGSRAWLEELTSADPGTFGFFMTASEIRALLPVYEGEESDYGICPGPVPYADGGRWLCAARGSDNRKLSADIIETITCNAEVMEKITRDTFQTLNNSEAMSRIALDEEFSAPLFPGANDVAILAGSAAGCRTEEHTYYDSALKAIIREAFLPFIEGEVTEHEALEEFYKEALARFPDLSDLR